MQIRFDMFLIFALIAIIECRVNWVKSPTTHPKYASEFTRSSKPLTNTICPETNYHHKYWAQNGGTNINLLGIWNGRGAGWILNATTGDIILPTVITDTWVITFESGHIRWNDTFRPDFAPTNPSDIFHRYLQQDAINGWYACTNTSQSATATGVDFDMDMFGQPVQISNLLNSETGSYDASCSYKYQTQSNIQVNCLYFDTLAQVPSGSVFMYYLNMELDESSRPILEDM